MGKAVKTKFMVSFLIVFIRFYQVLISPVFGKNCRFYPCCSDYFIRAIDRFGIVKGLFLFSKRIIRCHPFHPGGYDPLPEGNQE